MQGIHGCSARHGSSNDIHEILTPREVPRPPLSAGIKERNASSRMWVLSVGFGIFVTIAPWTCPRQIVPSCPSASISWPDMFAVKGSIGKMGGTAAVFAKPARLFAHLTAQRGRYTLRSRHFRLSNQVLP